MFQNRTKRGDLVWELASISPIRDDRGVVTHFVGVKEDFTEMKRLQDRMDNLAHHDQLTGLPNRTLFQDRLRQTHVLARRRGRGYALFYLDLDGFKGVNDNHGHERGDRLLQEVARRVSACVRETDTVARIGGDEFMVILADLQDRDTAASIARLITEAVIGPMDLDGVTVTIGVSIGISFCPRDADDPDRVRLLRRRRHVPGEEPAQERLRLLGAVSTWPDGRRCGESSMSSFAIIRPGDLSWPQFQYLNPRCAACPSTTTTS